MICGSTFTSLPAPGIIIFPKSGQTDGAIPHWHIAKRSCLAGTDITDGWPTSEACEPGSDGDVTIGEDGDFYMCQGQKLDCILYIYIYYIHTYIHTYITLHYITLHYITLQYITLHYITLHYITYITYIMYTHVYVYIYIYIHITGWI